MPGAPPPLWAWGLSARGWLSCSAVAALEVAQALRVLLGKADDATTRLKYVDV